MNALTNLKCTLALSAGFCALFANAQKQPHIILIMTDQQRGDAVGCMGNEFVITPHLDKLANEGTLFMNAYSSCPSSTPARAGLLTGMSPWHHGMLGYGRVAPKYEYEMPQMLKDAGCDYVIIGHSERRQYFSETDEMINKKAKAILAGGLIPIICCGETLEQREAGVTDSWIAGQIKAALEGISSEDIAKSVIAYEPIWAIGTGKTCDSDEANRVIAMIRSVVKEVAGAEAADAIRILYGGSVKPATIEEQMSKSDIDGALIGGASLKSESLNEIIEKTMKMSLVH